MQRQLPVLIFAEEDGQNLFMSDIIADLVPRLRYAGYEIYFDSCTGGLPIEEFIAESEKKITDYEKIANWLENFISNDIAELVGNSYDWPDKIRIKLVEAEHQTEEIINCFVLSTLKEYLDQFEKERSRIDIFLKELTLGGNISMLDPKLLIKINEANTQVQTLNDQFKDSVIHELHKCHQGANFIRGKINDIKSILLENMSIITIHNELMTRITKMMMNIKSLDGSELTSTFLQLQEYSKYGKPFHEEIADILFNETRSMFALVPLSEIAELQKILVKTQNNVNRDFDFIYLRGGPISEIHDENPEKIRAENTTSLPLGLTDMDITQKTRQEIVELVLKHVSARIAAGTSQQATGKIPAKLFHHAEQVSNTAPLSSATEMQLLNHH